MTRVAMRIEKEGPASKAIAKLVFRVGRNEINLFTSPNCEVALAYTRG